MGEPINVAARLESVSKAFPDHTGFIRESHLAKLPDDLMLKYEALEEVQLKGVDEVEMIYGLPRYKK
jgi:class 3 adenylate cyclase